MTETSATFRTRGAAGLEVAGLSVAYGGHKALRQISLEANAGQITGLIGPNGAGKTTTFNACSGLLRAADGTVKLFGEDVTGRSAAYRARRGLGRTFQRVEVVNSATVRANVALGLESRLAGANLVRQIVASRAERTRILESTNAALELCGLHNEAEHLAGTLSTGKRRLLELARVLAGGFQLLMLDEPSAGLDDDETARFGEVLLEVVAERGLGILLVEHDMELVMSVCETMYVLDFGEMIFTGTPAETQASAAVRAAYLGAPSEIAS